VLLPRAAASVKNISTPRQSATRQPAVSSAAGGASVFGATICWKP